MVFTHAASYKLELTLHHICVTPMSRPAEPTRMGTAFGVRRTAAKWLWSGENVTAL
jgi:hypothetical protein